ncbi:RNase adapter RapZ [Roseomonas fluvialis]|uniref:Nucleotide-binding protein n=1 Tax=Roseomonas fluvialis TaxID=1750527 RepID=A0ABN6NUZ7_9PROT|nr:RNase adapter RapZ [Roseomonas fluvialis]BDG70091.1 nucleotide-binding protein [Roseomonas fluvialis]
MDMPLPARRQVVLVTGMSGAGKASILRVLEDLGYETVDNPPLGVLEALVGDGDQPLAAGVDTRTRDFDPQAAMRLLERLRLRPDISATLVFATAEPDVLLRRYTETRRRHPMAPGGPLGATVADGIAREAALMAPLRETAELLVDTSDLPLPDLRRMIERRFGVEGAPGMGVSVMSFAFPKGLPREADLVFDLRFLRNPHYVDALRPLTGRDPAIAAFIEADPDFASFWRCMTEMLAPLLPRYAQEGKKYLTIALGCTGGKHRSVLAAERLAHHLLSQGWRVELFHRELPAGAAGSRAAGREAGREALTQVS